MLPGVCRDLLHLGSGDIVRIDSADPDPLPVDFEHDLSGPLAGHAEELLQHDDDEFHRRVVIVQQHDLEHRRRLQLAALRLQYGVVLVLRHAPEKIGQAAMKPVPILINWGRGCNATKGTGTRPKPCLITALRARNSNTPLS